MKSLDKKKSKEIKKGMKKIVEILSGITCETCDEERTFGHPPNNEPNNKYVYTDLSGSTRCFCKEHMSYGKENNGASLDYNDNWEYPLYGAKLISDIINDLYEND